jgi:hypothetical protein
VTFYPDLGNETMVASGEHVRAAGWLARGRAFPRGRASPAFLARLREFAQRWRQSTRELWWGTFRGQHSCELCGRVRMHGNFGVPAGEVLCAAPEMIAHYVEGHEYAPPAPFVAAVLAAPLPGTPEYRAAVEPFRLVEIRRQVPQYDDWKRQYPNFPGVRACAELLRSPGLDWRLGELVRWELYANAGGHLGELIEAFRSEPNEHVRFNLLYVIAEACLPEALPLLAEQLRSRDARLRGLACAGLADLGTPEARNALSQPR